MTAEEVAQKIAALNAERELRLASAAEHEQQARGDRAAAMDCKKQSAELTVALNSIRVKEIILSDQQAAAKARADAEGHAADVAKLKVEVAAELAKLKAASAKPAGPDTFDKGSGNLV